MIRSSLEKKEVVRVRDYWAARFLNLLWNRHCPIWRGTDPGLPEVKDARKRLAGLKGT